MIENRPIELRFKLVRLSYFWYWLPFLTRVNVLLNDLIYLRSLK